MNEGRKKEWVERRKSISRRSRSSTRSSRRRGEEVERENAVVVIKI